MLFQIKSHSVAGKFNIFIDLKPVIPWNSIWLVVPASISSDFQSPTQQTRTYTYYISLKVCVYLSSVASPIYCYENLPLNLNLSGERIFCPQTFYRRVNWFAFISLSTHRMRDIKFTRHKRFFFGFHKRMSEHKWVL